MSIRGKYKTILTAATPATSSTALTKFEAFGNAVTLHITTVAGGAGECTFTLKEAPGKSGTLHAVHDQNSVASWTIDVNTAGSYAIQLPTMFIPGNQYEFSYSCDNAAGTIAIRVFSWENTAGGLGDEVVVSSLPGGLTGQTEDTSHTSGDIGSFSLSVRADSAATTADTDGDYAAFITDANGRLHVIEPSAATIAGDTTSLDAKQPALGTALVAASSPVTIATDDTVATDLTAINTSNSTIAGDTTSIDGKTPALGAAATAASVPVNIASDQDVPITGDVAHDAADSGNPLKVGTRARSTQIAAVANDDRSDAISNLNGEVVTAGFNWTSEANATSETDPVDRRFETFAYTLTNVPNATPDETTLIDMDGFRGCSVHVEKTGGTDTFVWTMESSVESALSTADWIDTTQFGWTSATVTGAATYTADGILYANAEFTPRGHKVKITTAGGGNDADFQIFVKKWY